MEYFDDRSHFRWNFIALPGEQAKAPPQPFRYDRRISGYGAKFRNARSAALLSEASAETPQQALARIEFPQDVVDRISQLIVPGSTLIVSDQTLDEETGEGTNFIVVTR
jgi:hypothetical protein